MGMKKAISEFSEKLKKYNTASEEGKFYLKPGESQENRLETLMAEKDFAFRKTVVTAYRKYRFPFKTLGEKSSEAQEIAADQKSLESCYNLFKAVEEANGKSASTGTFFKGELVTPLAEKEKYVSGDDFIYLMCYLNFELKHSDFVPYFERRQDGSYCLKFTKAENARFSALQKDVMSVIKSTFYSSES